ncbi:hypothetical protein BT69DRAFT_1346560 [Atractiella rhizophila]|nr:hypothetical protein BT69DRAFT_1346560 [Atractiella rhizophila]
MATRSHSQSRGGIKFSSLSEPTSDKFVTPDHSRWHWRRIENMRLPGWARAAYTPTRLFGTGTTIALYLAWLLGLIGLILWNFFTQAKIRQCLSYSTAEWDRAACEPAQLRFASTYYTRPVENDAVGEVGTIGTFPWTPLGFGQNSTGPIDYSILSLTWTATPLECVMYEQSIMIHLDSESSTTATCYYCGTNLRILCTVVDSERTQLAISGQVAIQDLLLSYVNVSNSAHQIATTFMNGSTVLSVKMFHHNTISGVPDGVIPYTDTITQVVLGTTSGSWPVFDDNTDPAVAQLVRDATSLSSQLEIVASRDLMPDVGDTTTPQRTLLVDYLCKQCKKVYKPAIEVISIIIASVAAVLAPAFVLMKMLAEKLTVQGDGVEGDDEKIAAGGSKRASTNLDPLSPALTVNSKNGPYESYDYVGARG